MNCCSRICTLVLLTLSFTLSVITQKKGLGSDDEISLVKYLFEHKGYNPLIRPVSNLSDVVTVDLGLAMIQLIHVQWYDYQLKWNKDDFGGIQVIRVSPKKVWSPDIVLFNNADGRYEVSWQPNILVHNDGLILWIPPAIYKSSCTIDVRYFPFDQQKCEMKFGSWTFDASQVMLSWYEGNTNVDLSDYWKSGTWDLLDCPGKIRNVTKAGILETQIVYTITLQRKTLFYTVNLLIPCVLISFLSVCVFYLPADASEKITLSISILLALVVFLLLVSKILPPTSISIPLISKFLLFTFIMNIFTIFLTVIIINWNFRTPRTHRMNKLVRNVFMNYLPMFLCMKRPEHIVREEQKRKSWKFQLPRPSVRLANSILRGSVSSFLPPPTGAEHIPLNTISRPPPTPPAPPSLHNTFSHRWTTEGTARVQSSLTVLQQSHHKVPDSSSSALRHRPHHDLLQPNDAYYYNFQFHYDDISSTAAAALELANGEQANEFFKMTDPSIAGMYAGGGGADQGSSGEALKLPLFHGVEITPEIRNTIAAVNFISSHIQVEKEYMRILQDWKYVASVIDRVQLVLFMGITIAGTFSIILNAPYIFTSIDQDAVISKFSQ